MTSGSRVSTAGRLLALLLLVALAWQLREVAIVMFGAVLFAAALRAMASPLIRISGLPDKPVVAVVVLSLLLTLGLAVWLLGDQVSEQLQALRSALPRAW